MNQSEAKSGSPEDLKSTSPFVSSLYTSKPTRITCTTTIEMS